MTLKWSSSCFVTVLVVQKHKVLGVSYVHNLTLVTSQLYDTVPMWPSTRAALFP